ncbi:ABC transporter ATP-binding protein [Gordonia phthalatica]|uniref:Iron-dicitrate transporter ATP-binding subunit n=1 Tax=Gordonia phthalatica TaxID=1136941 RepID=A0A0N9MR27_9ACTN|nr:ABC transporter ATP-binding protein [Gordonia phthalatica]ALG84876.1 iron-dicitrate transporter ATP-binding subunit [Gordonia phthalatica]
MTTVVEPVLSATGLVVEFDGATVVDEVDLHIPAGGFTVILGPNACGKSTTLRAISRVLKRRAGEIVFDGRALEAYGSKELAQQMGLLAQDAVAPEGMRVADLISRGRHPYHSAFRRWTTEDDAATRAAMEATRTIELAERYVDQLSGGQRQRVWVALLLAQQTPVMLLDEPTTFLDIAHQYEVLDLLKQLNGDGKTVVAVLHDLNQAARYADNLVLMKAGRIVASGPPREMITEARISEVFGLTSVVVDDPVTGSPMVVRR